jgi:hypothetical protein
MNKTEAQLMLLRLSPRAVLEVAHERATGMISQTGELQEMGYRPFTRAELAGGIALAEKGLDLLEETALDYGFLVHVEPVALETETD